MKMVKVFLTWFFQLFRGKPDPRVEFCQKFYNRLQEILYIQGTADDYKQLVAMFDLKTIATNPPIFTRTWQTPVDEIFKTKAMIRMTINVNGQFCFTYIEQKGSRKKVEVILRLNIKNFKQVDLDYHSDSQHYPEIGLQNTLTQFDSLCTSCVLHYSDETVA